MEAEKPTVQKPEFSAAAASRVAKKNGATKIGKEAALALAVEAEKQVAKITKAAVEVANHAGRKVVRAEDVAFVAR